MGQRVDFDLSPNGTVDSNKRYALARGEYRENPGVVCWQVTLSPIFQAGLGPTIEGMSRRAAAPYAAGDIRLHLTYGGGGVSFRTQFAYPVNGTSFAVSGDNVQLELSSLDRATPYTLSNRPSVMGWIAPVSVPTSRDPLVIWEPFPNGVLTPLMPWCRALVVGRSLSAGVVTVAFSSAFYGPVVVELPSSGLVRVPVPLNAEFVQVASTLGVAQVGLELSFT